MSSISELQKQAHENSKSKGFWDGPFNAAEKLCLMHSEISEAMEADRKGKYFNKEDWETEIRLNGDDEMFLSWFRNNVKNTMPDELADVVIRVMDFCESQEIDLEWHIRSKMRYNATRPHMHGKKY
jgi:NTP pyrophosphatase (non-canonical NTP hydrolase)